MREEELRKISNPDRVFRSFEKFGLDGTIHISNLASKKYYVMTPEGRKVQFGSTWKTTPNIVTKNAVIISRVGMQMGNCI
jgi:hypothetical protein